MTSSKNTTATSEDRLSELCRLHTNHTRAEITAMWNIGYEHHVEGEWIVSTNGRRFLNMAGYGTQLLGTANKEIIDRVVEQLYRQPLSCRSMESEVTVEAAAKLAGLAPEGLDKVFFTNSGAEAVEAAIKIARANGKKKFICAVDGYHGKSIGALSVTGRDYYQDPFRPLMPGVSRVPFNDADALEKAIDSESAVFLEPVQGEAGVVIPDDNYIATVREICDAAGALFIVDEVQSGLGRCGVLWRSSPVIPDILLTGKTLSGGVVPVAAIVTTPDLYAPFDSDLYLHASTFGGSPIACSAVSATLDKIVEDDVPALAKALGERLEGIFRDIVGETDPTAANRRFPFLSDIRGEGCLWAFEFVDDSAAGSFFSALLENEVVANHSLNASTIVRFTPSAYLGEDDIRHLRDAVSAALIATEAE